MPRHTFPNFCPWNEQNKRIISLTDKLEFVKVLCKSLAFRINVQAHVSLGKKKTFTPERTYRWDSPWSRIIIGRWSFVFRAERRWRSSGWLVPRWTAIREVPVPASKTNPLLNRADTRDRDRRTFSSVKSNDRRYSNKVYERKRKSKGKQKQKTEEKKEEEVAQHRTCLLPTACIAFSEQTHDEAAASETKRRCPVLSRENIRRQVQRTNSTHAVPAFNQARCTIRRNG